MQLSRPNIQLFSEPGYAGLIFLHNPEISCSKFTAGVYIKAGGAALKPGRFKRIMSSLSVAGYSRALNTLMKIGWMNQTHELRFFTPEKDEAAMRKYIEAMICRTFGTENTMNTDKKQAKAPNSDSKQASTANNVTDLFEDIISEERDGDRYIKESTISYKSYHFSKETYVSGSDAVFTYYLSIDIHSLAACSDHIIVLRDGMETDVWGNMIYCGMQLVNVYTKDHGHSEHFFDLLIAHACEWI